MTNRVGLERRSGVALWRQIADGIRQMAVSGALGPDGRLPPEAVLAAHFGVNRHTVRSALAQLATEGVVRAERGRGTFIERPRRLAYPIAARTRFSQGLEGQAANRSGRLLASATEAASAGIAAQLALAPQAAVIRLETLSAADGRPVSRATSWFDAARFAGIADGVRETGSITEALRRLGVAGYLRRSTTVSARHADPDDLADLQLAPGAIVLVTAAVDAGLDGRPIQYLVSRFAADRVELTVTTG